MGRVPDDARGFTLAGGALWEAPWGGALEDRPRGAVPVAAASVAGAPQPAQNRAVAGTGCEHVGQGSVTSAC